MYIHKIIIILPPAALVIIIILTMPPAAIIITTTQVTLPPHMVRNISMGEIFKGGDTKPKIFKALEVFPQGAVLEIFQGEVFPEAEAAIFQEAERAIFQEAGEASHRGGAGGEGELFPRNMPIYPVYSPQL